MNAKPTSTREEHERIIPYSGHNSEPFRNRVDWEADSFPRGDGDVDWYGIPGQDDPNYQRVNPEPVYEEDTDVA